MYRKLVFVLTMFAVAFGSLSQAQAALASAHPAARVASAAHAGTRASIARHSATGAVRPATATRPMAPGANLRTEERQVSPHLGTGRRATGTASAPTITSAASLAAPKITSAVPPSNGACQIFSISAVTTFTVGQYKSVNIHTPAGAAPQRGDRVRVRGGAVAADARALLQHREAAPHHTPAPRTQCSAVIPPTPTPAPSATLSSPPPLYPFHHTTSPHHLSPSTNLSPNTIHFTSFISPHHSTSPLTSNFFTSFFSSYLTNLSQSSSIFYFYIP